MPADLDRGASFGQHNLLPAAAAGRQPSILAFIDDDTTAGILRSGLAELGSVFDLQPGTIRTAIRRCEKDPPSQALIVDITGIDNPQAALGQLARVCPPALLVFVVGERSDFAFYRMLLTHIASAEYLPKPLSRDAVLGLLATLRGDADLIASPTAGPGRFVAVCGARGGVGTTSIALNLAYEVMAAVDGEVALLDLHLQDGEIALMVSAHPRPGLRAALENATSLDPRFPDNAAVSLEPRLSLIASEAAFGSPAIVTETGMARVLDTLRARFAYIIADIPMPLPPAMQRVLTVSQHVVTVLTPDVASLRDTQQIRELVTARSGGDRFIGVLNRAYTKGGVSLPLIGKAIGGAPDIIIPELGSGMLQAINTGIPAVRTVPALRHALAPLVREIIHLPPGPKRLGWLRKLFG